MSAPITNILNVVHGKKSNKRKSDAALDDEDEDDFQPPPAKKRASKGKAKEDPHAEVKELAQDIIENPHLYPESVSLENTREQLVMLANYIALLEGSLAAAANSSSRASKFSSPEELEKLAEKLRKQVSSQIRKQMTWKPSCKVGGAKWAYEGTCLEPAAFQLLMQLPAPPTYKQTKIPLATLQEILCNDLTTSIRYGMLRVTSNEINVKWNKDTGVFRFAGSYGL